MGGGPKNEHIPPKNSQYTEITRERAEKLATLRRGRFDEFTWAVFTGLVASLPSALDSYLEVISKPTFSLDATESINFALLVVFLTLCAVAYFKGQKDGLSSMEYLELHFGKDPDAVPKKESNVFSKLFSSLEQTPPKKD